MYEWTEEEESEGFESITEPGRYLVEVKAHKTKTTQSGDDMWSLAFNDVETGAQVCWDNLSFGGGKGIAFKKMSMMGVPEDANGKKRVSAPDELIGLRFYVTVVEDSYQKPGTDEWVKNLKVNNSLTDEDLGMFMGYQREVQLATAGGKDDIPW